MPRHQAEFDLGLIEPAAVFGRVVDIEAIPEISSLALAEMIGQGFPAVDVEVIQDQVNGGIMSVVCGDEGVAGRRRIRGG